MRTSRIYFSLGYSTALFFNISTVAYGENLSTLEKNNAAIAKLSIIADLAKKPNTWNIDQLAEILHFSYRIIDCNKTEQFEAFCQYQVIAHEPAHGNILILALGQNK